MTEQPGQVDRTLLLLRKSRNHPQEPKPSVLLGVIEKKWRVLENEPVEHGFETTGSQLRFNYRSQGPADAVPVASSIHYGLKIVEYQCSPGFHGEPFPILTELPVPQSFEW